MTTKEYFIARINKWMNENNKTQKDISDLTGIDPAQISDYLNKNKTKMPSLKNMVRISEELGLSIDYMLGLTNDNAPVKAADSKLSAYEICEFLYELYNTDRIRLVPVQLEETTFFDFDELTSDFKQGRKKFKYYSIVFPSVLAPSNYEDIWEFEANGNENKNNQLINKFLYSIKELGDIKEKGILGEDDYNTLIDKRFREIKQKDSASFNNLAEE